MALDTLGETIDIHGGGRDLLFPHHENEIAQTESLTGKNFANYWSHCGLIKINGEKMSKSLGNSLTIRDALKKYHYEVLKYLMLSKHYAADIDILDSDFVLAESQMYYFYTTIDAMSKFIADNNGDANGEKLEDEIANNIIQNFIEAMDDDFNTSTVFANLHTLIKFVNNAMKTANKGNRAQIANTMAKILKDIKETYSVLGLFTEEPKDFLQDMKNRYIERLGVDVNHIEEQVAKRAEAKQNKDYATADEIRANLDAEGIILNDTKDGTTWDFKALYK